MHNSIDRSASSASSLQRKRLGGYLVEAGLLTPAQVDVALNDQKLTGMRFGEILAARGWVKQQTIEYLMHKVVIPEQRTSSQPPRQAAANGKPASSDSSSGHPQPPEPRPATRKELPIAKPLPSVNSADNDVSWVG